MQPPLPQLVAPRTSPPSLVSRYSPSLASLRSQPLVPSLLSPLSVHHAVVPTPCLPPLRSLPPSLPSFKPLPQLLSSARSGCTSSLFSSLSGVSKLSSAMPSPSPPSSRRRRGRRTAANSNLQCHICLQFYSRRDNLRVHQRVHTGERPFSCRYCLQPFRWQGALRNHESIHVRNGDTPLSHSSTPANSAPSSSSSAAPPFQSSYGMHASPPLYSSYPPLAHSAPNAQLVPADVPALEHGSQESRNDVVLNGVDSPLYTTSQGADWAPDVLDDLSPRDRSRE